MVNLLHGAFHVTAESLGNQNYARVVPTNRRIIPEMVPHQQFKMTLVSLEPIEIKKPL